MNTFAVIIMLLLVAYWLSNSSKKKQEEDNALINYSNQRTSRFPEIFSELMKEEYPEYRDSVTQAKVLHLKELHSEIWSSADTLELIKPESVEHRSLIMNVNDFETIQSREKYLRIISERLGLIISPEFQQRILRDPEEFYSTLTRLYSATNSKLDGLLPIPRQ